METSKIAFQNGVGLYIWKKMFH